ncbi:MAG: response regulator transcription factor [Alphaproteobacteria bacterium]|nr:response regulator transcription factor [Alphaproteobacteria bacterium]MBF0130383.1 response regulator transcription factor [Alphaproteobacteria bacterium]
MALDQRVIMFPPVILLTAMRLRAALVNKPLPHEAPDKVVFDPTKTVAMAIRFPPGGDGQGKPRDFRFSRDEVFQSLLLYCKRHDVPIPQEGIKRLDEINGRAAMMIYLGHEGTALGGTQASGQFPIKVVNLVRKLLKDVPPRTSKKELVRKVWKRSSFCIVDAHTMTRRALRAALVGSGAVNIDVCITEKDFTDLYGREGSKAFDVVIIGGLENIQKEDLLMRIRRMDCPSHLAVGIAVTAFADAAEVQKIISGGFHGILLAPFTKQALERVVNQLLMNDLLFEQHGDTMKTVLMKKSSLS